MGKGFSGYPTVDEFSGKELFVVEQGRTKRTTLSQISEYIRKDITISINDIEEFELNPKHNDVMCWNNIKQKWVAESLEISLNFSDLADVQSTINPNHGDSIKWNSDIKKWVLGSTEGVRSIVELSDVCDELPPENGQVLRWNDGKYKPSNTLERYVSTFEAFEGMKVITTPVEFEDLDDVDVWVEGIKLIRYKDYIKASDDNIELVEPLENGDDVEVQIII